MILVSTSHVTIKSEIRHCEKLISHNTGEFLWIMIHTNITSKQILCRTKIEGNDVKTNSSDIIPVWKSWIDDLVSSICHIPDFRFLVTEKINYQKIIMKVNLPAVNGISTNDHYCIFQCNGCVACTSFGQCSHLSPRVVFEFSDDISSPIATNDICCFWCWNSGVAEHRPENNNSNWSYFWYVQGLIKNKTYLDVVHCLG